MKNNTLDEKRFGQRLAQLRKNRGLSQTDLGIKLDISKRMVAYYEGQTNRPPAHLLIPLSKALKLSIDDILGTKKITISDPRYAKLWRRLKKAEQLSSKNQKLLFNFLDALVTKQ